MPAVEDLIAIAEIARPQGVRGEVIANILSDFPGRFANLKRAWSFRPGSPEVKELTIERARLHKGRIVLKLAGYDDMTSAETLRGLHLAVTRDKLVALPADTYYDFDLVDCEVSGVGGERIGRVRRVESYGAAPLLVVEVEAADGARGREVMIPFATSICVEIDPAGKRIVVDPPEGLLEL